MLSGVPITSTLPLCHRHRSESRVLRFCVPGQKEVGPGIVTVIDDYQERKRHSESGSGRETWGYHSSTMLAMSVLLLDRHFRSAFETGVVLFVRSCFATCSPSWIAFWSPFSQVPFMLFLMTVEPPLSPHSPTSVTQQTSSR